MMRFSIGNRLTPYLLTACAVLGGILLMENRNLNQGSPENPTVAAKPRIKPTANNNFTAAGFATYREITERPLFISGRRPPPKPKPQPKAPVKLTPLRLSLEGVVISAKEKFAVVVDQTTNEVLHMDPGMQHQGWELVSIAESAVKFERAGQVQELVLVED